MSRRPWRLRRKLLLGTLALALIGLFVMVRSTDYLDTLGGSAGGARLERIRRSPSFRDGVFRNAVPTTVMAKGSFFSTLRSWLHKQGSRPPGPLPSVPVSRSAFADPPGDDVRVCWFGHSSVLVEIEGARVLFDPVWAARSSPSRLVGPARFQPAPLPLAELPALDAVAISHDHYDHLDRDAIQQLARRDPALPFLVPLGVGAHLERWGIAPSRIHELDWWEERPLAAGKLRLIAAPARHFSGRGPFDRNRTLWVSWVLLGRARRVYFGGDGGPYGLFAELGRRFGPFDLTMLEIGAYHPNWGAIHLGPAAALVAHAELRGRHLLPIHWGAFDLGLHPWEEPIETLLARAAPAGATLLLPRLGEVVALGRAPAPRRWWR